MPIEINADEKTNIKLTKCVIEGPVPIDHYRCDLPRELSRIIMRMLEKNPEQRPSMRQVFDLLTELYERWKNDPTIREQTEVRDSPNTAQMKLHFKNKTKQLRARNDTEKVTHADA